MHAWLRLHIMCTERAVHVHKDLCMLLILVQKQLKSSMSLSFLFCPVRRYLLLLFIFLLCLLPCSAALICLFAVFTEVHFVAQPYTRHLLEVSIHLTLQTEKISLNRFTVFTYKLYQLEFRTMYVFVYLFMY